MLNWCKLFFILFFSIGVFGNFQIPSSVNEKTISHKMVIKHPGDNAPLDVILYEVQDENAIPISYYMDVKSVICLENVCKVIPVRIFWNEIGEYQKYELAKGATLEKYKNDGFEPEDYKKLNYILSNQNSPYRDIVIDEILKVKTSDTVGKVDAVSGATTVYINKSETIPGAALTCFTLWHWANGDVVPLIKNITGSSASEGRLFDFLSKDNHTYFFIALEAFEQRKMYSKAIAEEVVLQALKNPDEFNVSIKYIEKASSEIYFSSIKVLFQNGNVTQKTSAIRSLLNTKNIFDKEYLDDFSEDVKKSNSFQEVSLFLDLLQSKRNFSDKVIENTMSLLNQDFLMARRSFYFLQNQALTTDQLFVLKEFAAKYKGKL